MSAHKSILKMPGNILIFKVFLCLFFVSHELKAEEKKEVTCGSRFAQLVVNSKLVQWQKNYWKSVRENPSFLLVVPREEKRSFGGFLQDPISETFGFKKRMSIWSSAVAWHFAIDKPFEEWIQNKQAEILTEAEGQNLGGAYILRMSYQGAVPLERANEIIKEHKKEINQWLASSDGNTNSLKRLRELKKLGILKNEEEAIALNKLAKGVFRAVHEVEPGHKPNSKFAYMVIDSFAENLNQHPLFKNKTAKEKVMLSMLYYPELKIGDQSDLSILSKNMPSLDRILDDLGLPLTISMKAASLAGSKEEIRKKQERVKQILPESKHDLGDRVDIPIAEISMNIEGPANVSPIHLNDELDYWQLLMEDVRFLSIKTAWLHGDLSDVLALTELKKKLNGLQEVFKAKKSGNKITHEQLCAWMGYSKDIEINPNFIEARIFTDNLAKSNLLPKEQWQACRMMIGEYAADEVLFLATQEAQKTGAIEKNKEKLIKIVSEVCPKVDVQDSKQYACE